MRCNLKILIIASVLLISGCVSQYATTGEYVYKNAKNGVPIPLASSDTEDTSHFYDLPSQTKNTKVSIEPPED